MCKCQHQTVVDLVDLAGTESLAVLALKAVQAVQHPVPGGEGTTVPHARVVTMTVHGSAAMMTVQRVRVETTTARRGRAATMTDLFVRVVTMTVRGSAVTVTVQLVRRDRVVMMTVPHVPVAMILVRVDLELQRSSARMKSATRVAVAA